MQPMIKVKPEPFDRVLFLLNGGSYVSNAVLYTVSCPELDCLAAIGSPCRVAPGAISAGNPAPVHNSRRRDFMALLAAQATAEAPNTSET